VAAATDAAFSGAGEGVASAVAVVVVVAVAVAVVTIGDSGCAGAAAAPAWGLTDSGSIDRGVDLFSGLMDPVWGVRRSSTTPISARRRRRRTAIQVPASLAADGTFSR